MRLYVVKYCTLNQNLIFWGHVPVSHLLVQEYYTRHGCITNLGNTENFRLRFEKKDDYLFGRDTNDYKFGRDTSKVQHINYR